MTDLIEKDKHEACHDIAAWILTAVALLLVVKTHLLPALLAGLFVYEIVNVITRAIHIGSLKAYTARVLAVTLLAAFVVTILTLAIFGLIVFFRHGNEGLPVLLTKMAEILDDSRKILPAWIMDYFPSDAENLQTASVEWLKEHAAAVKTLGKAAGRTAAHILVGMVIGAVISLREAGPAIERKSLASALAERARRLNMAFRNVVFAQIRIAALNGFFTWLYLGVALPMMGIHLPLAKTMIAITFVVGLIPVVGNLISNTVIIILSLSHSVVVAISSLVFLVVIHKLEYFLNARIIGSRIKAQAWELLIAMLVMEVLFGIAGLIAAPIYYAYLKDELAEKGLI